MKKLQRGCLTLRKPTGSFLLFSQGIIRKKNSGSQRYYSNWKNFTKIQNHSNFLRYSLVGATAASVLTFTYFNGNSLLHLEDQGIPGPIPSYSAEDFVHQTEDAGEYEREDVPTSIGNKAGGDSGLQSISDPNDTSETTIVESEVTEIGPDGKTRKRKRRRKCQFIDEDEELLHLEFLKLQEWLRVNKKRVLVLIEGRDTAGQGGAIRYYTLHLNPKFYRVVTFRKPNEREKGEWYFQRYLSELPNPGQIVFFYHSWYNRAIVEPVMNYCSETEYKKFIRDVVLIEEMLKDDGLILIKFWFSITKDIQGQRLRAPVHNPLKRWKMKPASDWRILTMFHLISKFRDQMFLSTSTDANPWVIVSGLSKPLAKKESLKYILNMIPYKGKENARVNLKPDPTVRSHLFDNFCLSLTTFFLFCSLLLTTSFFLPSLDCNESRDTSCDSR